MTFYHGSPVGGLNELKPFLSDMKSNTFILRRIRSWRFYTPYILYQSHSAIIRMGLIRTVQSIIQNIIRTPFLIFTKANRDICMNAMIFQTQEILRRLTESLSVKNAVTVDRVTMIPNLYDCLMEYQQQGLFRIRSIDTISDKEMQYVHNDLKQTIQKHNLKQFPDNSMSRFIRKHFPEVWEKE